MPDLYRPCPVAGCDHKETIPPDADPDGSDDPSYADLWDHVATVHAGGSTRTTGDLMATVEVTERANPGDTSPNRCPICGPMSNCRCANTLGDERHVTRILYDTEFLEDGHTIELISIGIVADDGREYYAVSARLAARGWNGWRLRRRIRKHTWLMQNVITSLPKPSGDWNLHMPKSWLFNYRDPAVKPRNRIAADVAAFIQATPDAELWAWYGAYDHVALAQLFGRMIDLPPGVPMWTNDLRQEAQRLGFTDDDLPEQAGGIHNALADARHNLVRAQFLDQAAAGSAA